MSPSLLRLHCHTIVSGLLRNKCDLRFQAVFGLAPVRTGKSVVSQSVPVPEQIQGVRFQTGMRIQKMYLSANCVNRGGAAFTT